MSPGREKKVLNNIDTKQQKAQEGRKLGALARLKPKV